MSPGKGDSASVLTKSMETVSDTFLYSEVFCGVEMHQAVIDELVQAC